jgi:hypothetical protein
MRQSSRQMMFWLGWMAISMLVGGMALAQQFSIKERAVCGGKATKSRDS